MISARKYQEISSDLGDLLNSANVTNKEKRLIRRMKGGLDDMMERQLGDVGKDKLRKFRKAREQWAALETLKKSMGDVDIATGNVSPLTLRNQMKRKDIERLGTKSDPLTRAARFGQRVKPLVPNPGSAAALMLPTALGGAYTLGGGDPMTALGTAGGLMAAPWAYRGIGRAAIPAMQRAAGSQAVQQAAPAMLTGTPGQLLRQGMVGGIVPGLLDDQ